MKSFEELVKEFNEGRRDFTDEEYSLTTTFPAAEITFAHHIAINGYLFNEEDPAMSKVDSNDISTAHYSVMYGHRYTDGCSYLTLKTPKGLSVVDLADKLDDLKLNGRAAWDWTMQHEGHL